MRYAVGSVLVRWYLAPGGHIDLFIGHRSQAEYWTPILAQVRELSRPGGTGCRSQSSRVHRYGAQFPERGWRAGRAAVSVDRTGPLSDTWRIMHTLGQNAGDGNFHYLAGLRSRQHGNPDTFGFRQRTACSCAPASGGSALLVPLPLGALVRQRGQRKVQRLHLRVHDACKIVCRARQAHPDKQQVPVGGLAAFVQPEQHGDRDICGRTPGAALVRRVRSSIYGWRTSRARPRPVSTDTGPLARSARSLAAIWFGQLLIVFYDQERGRDLLCLGNELRVPEEQLGQQDGTLSIGQPSLPGTHSTIMPPGSRVSAGCCGCPHHPTRSSVPTSPTACTATNAASVVTTTGMMCTANSARICASRARTSAGFA